METFLLPATEVRDPLCKTAEESVVVMQKSTMQLFKLIPAIRA